MFVHLSHLRKRQIETEEKRSPNLDPLICVTFCVFACNISERCPKKANLFLILIISLLCVESLFEYYFSWSGDC